MDVFGSLEADIEVLVSLICLGLVLKILWPPSLLNSVNRVKSYGIISVYCPDHRLFSSSLLAWMFSGPYRPIQRFGSP